VTPTTDEAERSRPPPESVPSGPSGSIRVGAGILSSRLTGFVREAVFAYYFGASATADVWRAALRTPNLLQNLLGEGTLSASFIPVYAELLEEGREEAAGRFAGAALGILTVVAFGLALLGIAVAPWLVRVFFFEWEPWMQELGIRVIRILFPMTATLVLSAWALGILNTHRRFFISYVAPVFWNLAMITALVGAGTGLGWHAAGREADLVVALAWGAVVGGLLQLGVQLPWVVGHLRHFRLSLGRRVEGVREAIRNFLPVLTARGVVNVSGWLEVVLAAQLAVGAVAVLGFAQILYVLPISLFAMSVAASELPELSRNREAATELLVPRVRTALERIAFLLIPSALAYLFLGDVITAALFQRGSFGPVDTSVVYGVLGAYALGLPASSASRVLSSAYYALRDTRTPARIAYLRVGISLAVGVTLMFPLDRFGVGHLRFGAAGLALGASAAAWLEYGLLRRGLRKRIGSHGPRRGRVLRIVAAAVVASAAGVAAQLLLPVPRRGLEAISRILGSEPSLLEPILLAGETVLPFGVVYLGIAWILGIRPRL